MNIKAMTPSSMKRILSNEIPFSQLKKNAGIFEFYEDGNLSIGISWEDSPEMGREVYVFNLFVYDKTEVFSYCEDGSPNYASEYINIEGAYTRDEVSCSNLCRLLTDRWNEYIDLDLREGVRVYITGDSQDLWIADYNVRVSTGATVLMTPSPQAKKVRVLLDEIDHDKNVTAYVRRTGLKRFSRVRSGKESLLDKIQSASERACRTPYTAVKNKDTRDR